MPNLPISQLPHSPTPSLEDQLVTVHSGITSYTTYGELTSAMTGSLHGTSSWASRSISSLNAEDVLVYAKNTTGIQINKGTVVRIIGATGDNPLIQTASYTSDNNSANTLGITNQNIANDGFGYVMTEGRLVGIDTSTPGWVAGQLLYLGPNGTITGSAPVAPFHSVRLGEVLRVQQNNGSMYVRIDNGYEIGELHDVKDLTTSSSFGDILYKSGSIWTSSTNVKLVSGSVILSYVSSSLNFANDTAAATGGVPLGGLYHTSGSIKIRLV